MKRAGLITVDSSFLINFYLLGWLRFLCKVYDKVLVTPTVRRECIKIKDKMDALPCITNVRLSDKEKKMITKMVEEIKQKFPGEHTGECEALAVAHCRKIPLLVSDNFAPWYLTSRVKGISVEIERGSYVVAKALETGVIKPKNDKELEYILDELK
ncbi:MAG: hypothetical protein COS08_01035, partial [Euryarchaeota archaeon CG01_land_8_20_14_3_00_38_12]